MSTPASLYEIDLSICFMEPQIFADERGLICVYPRKSAAHFCSVFFGGRGGGPKSPYEMKPERDASSFCAVLPAHRSSVVSFAVLIDISLSLPRVLIVISPCKSVR